MDKVFRVNNSITIFLKDVDYKDGDDLFLRGSVNVVLNDRTEILLTKDASDAFIQAYENFQAEQIWGTTGLRSNNE